MHGSDLGDHVGVESYIDFTADVDEVLAVRNPPLPRDRRRRSKNDAAKKEYPPPIHSPWVMKKYCTNDGRLIIKEEKTKRQEYFQALRSNGRLVLNLVPINDAVPEYFVVNADGGEAAEEETVEAEEEEFDGGEENVGNQNDEKDKVEDQDAAEEDQTAEKGGREANCCSVSNMGANPCGFNVVVPAFRPVQTYAP